MLVAAIFAVLNLGMIAFLVMGWRRVPVLGAGTGEGMSVVIAARNEEENLGRYLPAVLGQEWEGEWEVIVVLDRCSDGSLGVVEELGRSHGRLRWVEVKETEAGWAPKKYALKCGMGVARYDRLVFTDADCRPEGGWLDGMDRCMKGGNEVVLGLGPYVKRRGLLNMLVRFETLMTAVLYVGLAAWGRPYMAVGRNLGYRKGFFERVGGFGDAKGRLSGDDDLLVNRAAEGGKTGLLVVPGTWTYSEAPGSWGKWVGQKLRHLSAAPAYGRASKLILALHHGAHLIFYLSLMLALCIGRDPLMGAAIWGCRAVFAAILWACIAWPERRDLLLLSPFLDVLYLVYLVALGPAGMVATPKWRGK